MMGEMSTNSIQSSGNKLHMVQDRLFVPFLPILDIFDCDIAVWKCKDSEVLVFFNPQVREPNFNPFFSKVDKS